MTQDKHDPIASLRQIGTNRLDVILDGAWEHTADVRQLRDMALGAALRAVTNLIDTADAIYALYAVRLIVTPWPVSQGQPDYTVVIGHVNQPGMLARADELPFMHPGAPPLDEADETDVLEAIGFPVPADQLPPPLVPPRDYAILMNMQTREVVFELPHDLQASIKADPYRYVIVSLRLETYAVMTS